MLRYSSLSPKPLQSNKEFKSGDYHLASFTNEARQEVFFASVLLDADNRPQIN